MYGATNLRRGSSLHVRKKENLILRRSIVFSRSKKHSWVVLCIRKGRTREFLIFSLEKRRAMTLIHPRLSEEGQRSMMNRLRVNIRPT